MGAPQRCEVCGLAFASIAPGDAVVAVRSFPRRYHAVLAGATEADAVDADDVVRRRPSAGVWSALEYTAHVAAVFELYDGRVQKALSAPEGAPPTLESVDPEALGAPRAASMTVEGVNAWLEGAAEGLASTLDGVSADEWTRPARRDGEEVDVLWLARQATHEGSHHLRDTERSLRDALGSGGR